MLPAYNEEALIERTVRRVAALLREFCDDYEVVVADDGSHDRTGEILARLQSEAPELCLRVVTHPNNQGYGAALASGFDAARKDLIFITNGDEQFDVSELDTFLAVMDNQADLVIGWRHKRADPPLRLLDAWGWKLLVNGLFGYTARDVDCAFKLFRREVWESVTVRTRGATFSAEFLIKARQLGFQVRELPVSHFPRAAGNPTRARLDVITRALRELLRLRLTLHRDLAAARAAPPSRRAAAVGRAHLFGRARTSLPQPLADAPSTGTTTRQAAAPCSTPGPLLFQHPTLDHGASAFRMRTGGSYLSRS